MEHVDVLVVGAGISGIGAGYHLQDKCPDRSYAILEGRDDIGGTWDLFRYPGIRSDSDMYTLGYSFKPWTDPRSIADGPAILEYLKETAAEYGIDEKIRFGHHVKSAAWSSDDALWTVDVERKTGKTVQFTCNFLFMCTGYYNYEAGYTPEFEGADDFSGQIVHPQKWTDDIDYAGKKVIVIGSGATAVTLVPDGDPVDASKSLSYKGMMFSDIPNIATSFGYTNASWTLKCDLTCKYVCRLLNHMKEHGYQQCCPRLNETAVETEPFIDFSSGYVLRAIDRFPKQGAQKPWKVYQNYLVDKVVLSVSSVTDGVMEFSSPTRSSDQSRTSQDENNTQRLAESA